MFGTASAAAAPPAEASWQYLGDLPYRRLPIYSNVQWTAAAKGEEGNEDDAAYYHHQGLALIPRQAVGQRHAAAALGNDALAKTTTTLVVACPHGGPLAAMTLPLVTEGADYKASVSTTVLRILTNSGLLLTKLIMPPPNLLELGITKRYTAAHILTMGFTARNILVVVFRDSLCLTYTVSGETVLPPFYILPPQQPSVDVATKKAPSESSLLQAAHVYEGGVAVLAHNKAAALVELLDDWDDPLYSTTAHATARRIVPSSSGATASTDFGLSDVGVPPPQYALVTPLPTAPYAASNFLSYLCLAVLSRSRTTSRHPEVYLSTSDNSVIVVDAASLDVVDVDCRQRLSSPICSMTFAPNGRFLACFTESSMLTVISTSFETKVLDFDTSEGSLSPPLAMEWCGEDSVVLHWRNLGVLMVSS